MKFSWMALERLLSPAALTVMAQTIDPMNIDQVDLFLRFFPFTDVDSTELRDITTIDFRPVADRREWNAPGRLIPLRTPDFKDVEFSPIEAYHAWDEKAINKLAQRALGNEQVIRDIIKNDVPGRTVAIAESVWRRANLDAMTAWCRGTVSVKNPQTGESYDVSFDMDAERYQVAGTAWSSNTVNAFDLLLAWLDEAKRKTGGVKGAVMRTALQTTILRDAPDQSNGVRMTRGKLADRISEELGAPFEFVIIDATVDEFVDGGTTTQTRQIWDDNVVAAIPSSDAVGRMARAPVYRGGSLVAGLGPDQFDERDVSIFIEDKDSGKGVELQGQANWFPLPDEGKVYVMDTEP